MYKKYKLLIWMLIYIFIGTAMLQLAFSIKAYKIPHQMAVVAAVIFYIMALFKLRSYYKKNIRTRLFNYVYKKYERVKSRVNALIDKLFKKLHINRHVKYRGSGDTKEYVFIDKKPSFFERLKLGGRPKWHESFTNSEKIRFLYMRLIVKYVKKGCTFRASRTPRENCKMIVKRAESENSAILFELYEPARYAPNPVITDAQVEQCRKIK